MAPTLGTRLLTGQDLIRRVISKHPVSREDPMANEPGEVYGEPKYPVRMNYVTTEEQRAAIDEVKRTDGITLGEAQRRLIEEALNMRAEQREVDEAFAEGGDGSRERPIAIGLARVGGQLVAPRSANTGLSRAQLIAQERGERE